MKIALSKNEIQALISLVLNADYNAIEDIYTRELVGERIRRVLDRLSTKHANYPAKKKKAQMGFKPAELAAIYKVLKTYDGILIGIYGQTLITKIIMLIQQKAA